MRAIASKQPDRLAANRRSQALNALYFRAGDGWGKWLRLRLGNLWWMQRDFAAGAIVLCTGDR
jgi:hypothetical protein